MSFISIALTTLVAIVSLLIGAVVTWHYSSRRHLALVVPSLFDVIDLRRISKKKIQILYNQTNIESLWVIRVIIQNRGNVDIDKSMIRRYPTILFDNKAHAIDVEPIDIPEDTIITASINETGTVSFSIEYLQRQTQAAFQVLVQSKTIERLTANDLSVDKGTIKNTKVDFINFSLNSLPRFIETFVEFMRKYHKAFVVAYTIFSFACITAGGFSLLIHVLSRTTSFFTRQIRFLEYLHISMYTSMLYLFNGIFILIPTLYMWRRLRYLSVFINKKADNTLNATAIEQNKVDDI